MPLNIKMKGLGSSVMEGSTAGQMAKVIAFHKAPKPSLNPAPQKHPISFRKYNPVKVAIHARGSKKVQKGLKGIVQQNAGSINTKTPGASGIAFGGE